MLSKEKELLYLWDILCKPHGNHKTNLKQRHKTKQEEMKIIIENHQIKIADRKTREKKQWRYRATSKQK